MIQFPQLCLKSLWTIILIFSFNSFCFAQQPNDCQFAVTVCGNSDFNLDVNGVGTQELNNSNSCGSREYNSIWLKVDIATDGTLAFTLTPDSNSINEDYDFFVFGPNVECGNIGQAIRCSTTNPAAANQGNNLTGLNSTSTETFDGPGANGDSFVSEIDALAGESYFIVIDRPIGNSPFSMEWTGTATFPEAPTNPLLDNLSSTSLPTIDICDNDAPFDDNIIELDFTSLTQDIINNESDVEVSYHLSESDANININPLGNVFNNTSPNETIYVRVENTTSGCYIINDFDINVSTLTNFNQPSDYRICDNDLDGDDQNGQVTFDFNIKSEEILDGIVGVNYDISYHLSQSDAETSTSALPLLYSNTAPTPTDIFVRIQDLDLGCIGFTSFKIHVNPKPIAHDVTLIQCDEDGIPEGFTTFNITEVADDITGGNPDTTISYYLSLTDAENQINEIDGNAFENYFNPQIIYARVTNQTTSCSNISHITLEVSTTSTNNTSLKLCDTDGIEDGFMEFNLADAEPIILAGAPADLDITYYENYDDALVESNALGSTFTNTIPYNQTIYARVENTNACYGISTVELSVFALPNIETTSEAYYCLNLFPETLSLSGGVIDDIPNNYSYLWSTGETTTEINANSPGTYTVRVTNSNGCFKDRVIKVLPSNIASITNIEIVDGTINNSVSILVNGEGNYEYALEDIWGPYQDSNTFENVPPGLYTVYIRDKNNCGITEDLISVIGFPRFFTPNDDNNNDFWQVKGISSEFQSNSTIYIFDRYGQLLKELDPLSVGWDGTFNGIKLPSSDYWFKVQLEDGRTFTSHFTLKR
ncbi:gliding motility-associated-like protein [Winogradskyella epiphytica]|uniref:Gliding motility-associated-like protein n=1 Tax=Winogradskyella epiphytica TaxID=262005 RepID=A0A2V4WWC3_9FLAO|nr:T9SS type B sorting domain-containing protein [Winogradskyella epiphytica]PYE81002.1 gliding motility-associated-like protein [Winogradskyella epiphytica]GGW66128.1 T9SS C-terminal target domain-containing protein [Winogradskyella epiphytica]